MKLKWSNVQIVKNRKKNYANFPRMQEASPLSKTSQKITGVLHLIENSSDSSKTFLSVSPMCSSNKIFIADSSFSLSLTPVWR